jgi:dihydrofolate synthase/folylpolyglutamate synthase
MAIALLHYKSEHCDIVVLETGIGGAVDSTNIVENTVVSVITSISLDHTAILGDTLAKIATQKVGIVKPNRPVVLSNDNVSPEVVSIVEDYAKRMHSELYVPELANVVDMSIKGETFTYGDETYHLKMLGKHQVANASTVIETCKLLNSMCYDIPMECVKASLERTQVPFRMEVLDMGVKVIVDGSHNVGGVTSLIDTLKTCGIDKVTLLTGMISTKDYSSCCKLLDGIADTVICTDGYIYNAVPSDELAKLFTCEVIQVPLNDALHTGICTAKKDGSVLVMCGSLYLLSHLCA